MTDRFRRATIHHPLETSLLDITRLPSQICSLMNGWRFCTGLRLSISF